MKFVEIMVKSEMFIVCIGTTDFKQPNSVAEAYIVSAPKSRPQRTIDILLQM